MVQSILVSGKPHVGTDRLVHVLKAFRQHLLALGAEVRFGAKVDDLLLERGKLAGVRLAGEWVWFRVPTYVAGSPAWATCTPWLEALH